MARVVGVLSRSTTPTGMSVGTPACIIEVKNQMMKMGNNTMQNQ